MTVKMAKMFTTAYSEEEMNPWKAHTTIPLVLLLEDIHLSSGLSEVRVLKKFAR